MILDEKSLKNHSRFLSRILRHKPELIGIVLDNHGYVAVETLLNALQNSQFPMTRAMLDEVVANNDKKRFSYSDDGLKIRANQGHSVAVDLNLSPQIPPPILYHGTAIDSLDGIWQMGLIPKTRHHVHLSGDVQTAIKVGKRHGAVAVLRVDTAQMVADGVVFYRSANGVWLVDTVPPKYLERLAL
ncbi:RNA 2'-phosphotransferase [Moraxella oblonga]|uniref:RNA 2'-phosphotransferase n=1 Tax=Moraxella oblonga TaxID=200413 RepID=UPI00082AD72C|nr:RNA 2'-phosphotransferase [Moraxella oblonga]